MGQELVTVSAASERQDERTSSHQFRVEVTGLQYPTLDGGYGKNGKGGH